MQRDIRVLEYIQTSMHTEKMDRLMPAVTRLADGGIAWFVICAILYFRQATRDLSYLILISLGIEAVICNLFIKPFAARKRPCDVNPDVPLLIRRPKDASFPSGHTGASFAATAAMFIAHNRLWIPSGLLACTIGFSRLYLYVHYPSDVISGAILGILAAMMAQPLLIQLLALL